MEHGNNVRFLSDDGDHIEKDDYIEVISEHYETQSLEKRPERKPRKSILDDIKLFQDAAARKKFTRWVMLLGGVFIFLSGILLIVTLNMSKDIDDKVRDSNEVLRQHSENRDKVNQEQPKVNKNLKEIADI